MYMIINHVMGKSISFATALETGCIIFLPGDTLKAIVSSLIASKVLQRIKLVNE